MRAALTAIPESYDDLRRSVEQVLLTGRKDIEAAWVRTYHETGRLIHVHILRHQKRAGYGAKVFIRLAKDTHVSSRTLQECVQFYRCFPILRVLAELGWNRCRLLCQVVDAKQRERLARETAKAGWSSPQLETRVRALNAALALNSGSNGANGTGDNPAAKPAPELLTPKRGVVGRYRVVAQDAAADSNAAGRLCIDVGFKLYLPLSPAQARHRTPGEIVSVGADGSIRAVADGKPSDLFTYRAAIRRVVDGDTVEVMITLPHVLMREKLRLRGLDCPEMGTAGGEAAKRVVEALAHAAKSVTIYTTKPDKYDRYLADVFIEGDSSQLPAASKPSEDGSAFNAQPREAPLFLNNHLLENGLAVRKEAWEFSDWEKFASR